MSGDKKTSCLSCDFGDIDIMRNSGYTEDKYIFCDKYNDVVQVREICSYCETQYAEQRKQKRFEEAVKKMADALEAENKGRTASGGEVFVPQYDENGEKILPCCYGCDFADLSYIRDQGMDDGSYVYCEKYGRVMALKYSCEFECHEETQKAFLSILSDMKSNEQ